MNNPGASRKDEVPERSPLDTAEFSYDEIRARLELGRLHIRQTEEGFRLEVAHVAAPEEDRRHEAIQGGAGEDRRRFSPLEIPTLFPEQGAILLMVVGGFADDSALARRPPFWKDDQRGGSLIWQALQRAGFVHHKDRDLAVGQGGFWEAEPPRTMGLAMTYAGYRKSGEAVDFEHVVRGWNIHRLQTLAQESLGRSMGRLRVVAVGEASAFMMSGCLFGMHGIPLLSLPEPTRECLDRSGIGRNKAADYWVEWAADLMESAKS